jgi:hypothetical protein
MGEEDDRPIGRTSTVAASGRRVIPWIWERVVANGAVARCSPRPGGSSADVLVMGDQQRVV